MNRVRRLFTNTNNNVLTIVVFVLIVAVLLVAPQLFSNTGIGVPCSGMAHPIAGGNNGSLLSQRSNGMLSLNVSMARSSLAVGEPLVVNVTFVNDGIGAITLFLVPEEALLRNDTSPGLSFLIQRSPDGTILGEPNNVRPPNPQRTTFPVEILHVIGPRQRCTEQLSFNATRISSAGLGTGRYLLQAIYRNPSIGTVQAVPGAVATPIFSTQGVYVTQDLRSNQVEFTIGLATPTPLPQLEVPVAPAG